MRSDRIHKARDGFYRLFQSLQNDRVVAKKGDLGLRNKSLSAKRKPFA